MYRIQPLQDPRWADLVDRHPHSSVFHTVAWLKALQSTYRYEPVAWTTSSSAAPLENAIVFCRVASRITGRRLVSLPFSDHCDSLINNSDLEAFAEELRGLLRQGGLRYVECRLKRCADAQPEACHSAQSFCFHEVDLRPSLETLFANCHKSSTQRKILRAEREGLVCACGRSRDLFEAFYCLLTATRRRHGVPPQPRAWFQNLIECFGEALHIRVAFHGRHPAAAIFTLRHRQTLVYKYGCSDVSLSHLGGTQLLFWRAIQDAKRDGLLTFDLGRSDWDQPGLITFKDRLGATRSTLTYTRLMASPPSGAFHEGPPGWKGRAAKRLISILPDSALQLAGSVLYKHFA